MILQGKRILVTGAGGFIGSHLAEQLTQSGAAVRAMVHYNALGAWGWLDESPHKAEMEVIASDVRDADAVRDALRGVDIVLHLAALIAIPYSFRAPRSYVETNVLGTLNVLQAARDLGTSRVVLTSTSEVYGTARSVPIDEQHPLQGQSPYAASKIGADKLGESYRCSFDLPVVTVRPFNCYGPRQSARAVIPTIITQALRGDAVRLGNLAPTRDLTFVADTVAGFIAAATASEGLLGETINLGQSREISIGQLAELIIELTGRRVPLLTDPERVRPSASEVERLCADNSKAARLLGWSPRTPLRQGLTETIAWIERNLNRYQSERYTI